MSLFHCKYCSQDYKRSYAEKHHRSNKHKQNVREYPTRLKVSFDFMKKKVCSSYRDHNDKVVINTDFYYVKDGELTLKNSYTEIRPSLFYNKSYKMIDGKLHLINGEINDKLNDVIIGY